MTTEVENNRKAKPLAETEYAYAVAYVRTLESRLLDQADYEALSNAKDYQEGLRILSDKGYGGITAKEKLTIENILEKDAENIWQEVSTACPLGAPLEILLYQNDFHNLKAIMKAVFGETDHHSLVIKPYSLDPDLIYQAIAEGKPELLPEPFTAAAVEAYNGLARDNDGQAAEIGLDKAYYEIIKAVAAATESSFLSAWVADNITLTNVKIAVRGIRCQRDQQFLRQAMIEGGKLDCEELIKAQDEAEIIRLLRSSDYPDLAEAAQVSLAALEKCGDDMLMRSLHSIHYHAFGFEPILGFLIGKQYEWQALRIVFSGLSSGMDGKAIKERLRERYV